MRLSKALLIAVMVLGVALLVYWAKLVKDYESPVSAPVDATAPMRVEPQSEHTPTQAAAPLGPLAENTGATSQTTPTSQTSARSLPPQTPSSSTAASEPIPLTAGVRQTLVMLRKSKAFDSLTTLHDKISVEPRDPDWAYAMEQTLNTFFLSRSSQLGIEVPSIACRTSGCEVQLTTNQKPSLIEQLMTAARAEPWYATFRPHQLPTHVMKGTEYFWLILERK